MMRDYKFQQTTWPVRGKRKGGRLTLRILAIFLVAAAGYAAMNWFQSPPTESAPSVDRDSRIIPLQLPPNRSASGENNAAPPTDESR